MIELQNKLLVSFVLCSVIEKYVVRKKGYTSWYPSKGSRQLEVNICGQSHFQSKTKQCVSSYFSATAYAATKSFPTTARPMGSFETVTTARTCSAVCSVPVKRLSHGYVRIAVGLERNKTWLPSGSPLAPLRQQTTITKCRVMQQAEMFPAEPPYLYAQKADDHFSATFQVQQQAINLSAVAYHELRDRTLRCFLRQSFRFCLMQGHKFHRPWSLSYTRDLFVRIRADVNDETGPPSSRVSVVRFPRTDSVRVASAVFESVLEKSTFTRTWTLIRFSRRYQTPLAQGKK